MSSYLQLLQIVEIVFKIVHVLLVVRIDISTET